MTVRKNITGSFTTGTDKTKEEEEPQMLTKIVSGAMVVVSIAAVATSGVLLFDTGRSSDTLLPLVFLNASMYFLAAMLAAAMAVINGQLPRNRLSKFEGTLTEEDS